MASGTGAPVDDDRTGKTVPINILVVDDDDPVRTMLARLLQTHGYVIRQAANAAQANRLLEAEGATAPDLVISDIVMEGETGIELRRRLLARLPGLPVILISGYSPDAPAEFAANTPGTAFLQKPFATETLLVTIEQLLAARRA